MNTTLIKIFAISSLGALLAGCAVFGSDVQGLYNVKEAHTKVFDKSISRCYKLTTQALKKWGAVRFQKSKDDYIVAMEFEKVFRSCIDTTELGIFFTETGPHKTEVRVTSLNYNLSELISQKLFEYIEKDGKVPIGERLKPSIVKSSRNPFKK